MVPVVGFSLGYPDEEPPLRDRLPLEGLVHYETYHDYSDDQIREIYRERNTRGWKRYMTYPRLRRLIEESGVENLAQIYTVVKYTRQSHQEFSRKVLQYLMRQDFLDEELLVTDR